MSVKTRIKVTYLSDTYGSDFPVYQPQKLDGDTQEWVNLPISYMNDDTVDLKDAEKCIDRYIKKVHLIKKTHYIEYPPQQPTNPQRLTNPPKTK